MKISSIRATELDASLRQRWAELQDGNAALGSPFFSVEFTRAAAAARHDVRVAVLEDSTRGVVGFFPFQQRWGAGEPVGGRLSDHHGLIAARGTRWDWQQLLRASRLAYWRFDHLAAAQCPRSCANAARGVSPGIDLSGGFEAWKRARLAAGKRRIAELDRKARKLAREVGPLRFEAHVRDARVFDTVLRWKREQCLRTGAIDFLSWDWTRRLLHTVEALDEPAFGARLSALYAGDTLVAAHFGMRSQRVWHWWLPTYDQAQSQHSPGALLLMEVAAAAAAEGHALLDLGKGDEAYKRSFADCGLALVEDCVARPSLQSSWRTLRQGLGRWLRTPAAQPLQPMVRQLRRVRAYVGGSRT